MGHVFGDKVLKGVADRFGAIVDESVFVSRFGGDEFLILLKEKDEKKLEGRIKDIGSLFSEKVKVSSGNVDIRFSMGISLFPQHSSHSEQLIMNSDVALYSVKREGKNGFAIFKPHMLEHIQSKSVIEMALKSAIDQDELKMVYQPIFDLKTRRIVAYEALMRMRELKFSPAEFIPVAEESGLIIPIGRWTLEEVLKQIRAWRRKGAPEIPIAVNFSAKQLLDEQFIGFVDEKLKEYELSGTAIEFEITENIFIENHENTMKFLNGLKARGIKISVDDFGTGYSSLSYLTYLPVDRVKLDKKLGDRFLQHEDARVMDSIISLAHSLNLEVVAEGVEEKQQLDRLSLANCDYVQGYYFSKPVEAEDVMGQLQTEWKTE